MKMKILNVPQPYYCRLEVHYSIWVSFGFATRNFEGVVVFVTNWVVGSAFLKNCKCFNLWIHLALVDLEELGSIYDWVAQISPEHELQLTSTQVPAIVERYFWCWKHQ